MIFFYPCCSNLVRMADMLWIEDNFENTPSFSFLTNSRVDMADFVNRHKMVA
jgi:hypothetical protein